MYIKLFEAFSVDDYQKAISKVKTMLVNNKPNDEILSYINTLSVDSAKSLNKLRILSDRIVSNHLRYLRSISYIKSSKTIKKRKDGSDWRVGHWKAGDVVTIPIYDYKKYYMVDERYISSAYSFLQDCEKEYTTIISDVSDSIDTKSIQYLFGRLFEIMKWIIDNSGERILIRTNHDYDDVKKISKLEEFNKLDMENEVDELSRLNRVIKRQVSRSINSI